MNQAGSKLRADRWNPERWEQGRKADGDLWHQTRGVRSWGRVKHLRAESTLDWRLRACGVPSHLWLLQNEEAPSLTRKVKTRRAALERTSRLKIFSNISNYSVLSPIFLPSALFKNSPNKFKQVLLAGGENTYKYPYYTSFWNDEPEKTALLHRERPGSQSSDQDPKLP